MQTATALGLKVPVNFSTDERTTCPFCSKDRRKRTDRCMSIRRDGDTLLYNCHHCGEHGIAALDETTPINVRPKVMSVANAMDTHSLDTSAAARQFLTDRGISVETAKALNVKVAQFYTRGAGRETECLAFPYTNQQRVYACKLRSVVTKAFACNGAPQTFFNIDRIKDPTTLIITEGELDVLALAEAGIESISIPNGAVAPVAVRYDDIDRDEDRAFRFLWNAEGVIGKAKKVIIATDGDKPGHATAEEIARRIGRDRCWQVTWPDGCKDANDTLIKHGTGGLKEAIDSATPWPVAGLYEAADYFDAVDKVFTDGLPGLESTGYADLDRLYRIGGGTLTVVTGLPGSGKSELIDQLMINVAQSSGWRFAICSFENPPHLHIAKLAQKLIGKPFFSGLTPRMTSAELDTAKRFISNHFSFVHQSDGSLSTLDSIIERLKVAVLRHGIRGAVIDPYNYISKSRDLSETDWISEMLSRVRTFAVAHDLHVWFVAHPTKMARNAEGVTPPPVGGDISGSAAWFAKADFGLTVHRVDRAFSNVADVIVWKVRWSWTGSEGRTALLFDPVRNTYREPISLM